MSVPFLIGLLIFGSVMAIVGNIAATRERDMRRALRDRPAAQVWIWVIHRPDYGDSDGLPVAILSSKCKARDALIALNAPWNGVLRDGRPIRPYKLRRMLVDHSPVGNA